MPSAPRRRKPAHRYHHGDLPRAARAEALRIIQTGGPEGLTLRDIATRLGVAQSALYRHFDNKGALLAAVAGEGFVTLRRELLAAWETAPDTFTGFDAMGEAYVRFAVSYPSHYRIMFGAVAEARDVASELEGASTDAFRVLLDALAALQRAGLVRQEDPQQLALYVWAQSHGIAMLALSGLLPSPDAAMWLARFANIHLRNGIASS